jgi:tetratricopeptide (TPR) repeat protein
MNVAQADDLFFMGRPELAADGYRDALELDPEFWLAFEGLGEVHEAAARLNEAISAFESAVTHAGGSARARAHHARALALGGRQDDARRIVRELQSDMQRSGNYYPLVATALHALGETEQAFDWLESAYRQRHPNLTRLVVDPGFTALGDDPRFLDLLRRIGLPQ